MGRASFNIFNELNESFAEEVKKMQTPRKSLKERQAARKRKAIKEEAKIRGQKRYASLKENDWTVTYIPDKTKKDQTATISVSAVNKSDAVNKARQTIGQDCPITLVQPLQEADKVEVDKDGNKSIRDEKTGHLKRIQVSKKTQDKMADKYNKKQELNETGEWDDNDEEMQAWKESMREAAEEIARNVDGECKSVHGFDAYQGPFAVVSTPKHGDVIVWFGQEEGLFDVKVAHVGWIEGSIGDVSLWLNKDKIPEEFIIKESEKFNGKELKEDDVIQIPVTDQEPDYIIEDVTELNVVGDGDVQAPDIEGLLTLVDESLRTTYGDKWGHIRILSSNKMNENASYALVDISTPEIIKEFESRGIEDAAVGKNLILENNNGKITFKVNSLHGSTKFSKVTENAEVTIKEWIETEYLHEAMIEKFEEENQKKVKELKDTVENYIANRPDLKMEIANIEMFIELAKKDDSIKGMIQNRMYGLAAEIPNTIKIKDDKDNKTEMSFGNLDEVVELLFGKQYVKEVPEDNKVVGIVKESEDTFKNMVTELHSYVEGNPKTISQDLKKAIQNKSLDQYLTNKAGMSNEEISNFKNKYSLKEQSLKKYYIIVQIMNKYNKGKEGFLGNNNKIVADEKDALLFNSRAEAQKALRKYNPEDNYTLVKSNIESKKDLKESYQQFNIGDIEVVFNPDTFECLYSIPSAEVTDKKINLSEIPTVETPYDTNTIIKDYVERKFGRIPSEEKEDDKKEKSQPTNQIEKEPAEAPNPVTDDTTGGDTDINPDLAEPEENIPMDESYNSVEDAKRKLGDNWPTYQDDVEGKILPIPTRDEYERMWDGEDRSQYANTSYEGFLNALVDSGELTDEELYNILLNDGKIEEAELPEEPSEEEQPPMDTMPEEPEDEIPEEKKAETGSAVFVKIRPKQVAGLEDVREKLLDGNTPQSNYIVVDEKDLTDEEWDKLTDNLTEPESYLIGLEALDRKNYSFNVIKLTNSNANYDILVDPLGYDYPRYLAIIDK